MKNLIDKIKKGAEIADDFHESAEERQATLSKRHMLDMNSDNPLSKSIRPIVTIWTGLIWGVITLLAIVRGEVDWEIYGIASSPFVTCISWYFESRRREKIAAQNAQANIRIERIRTRHEIRQERRESRKAKKEEE